MTWFEGTPGARRSGARQRGIIVALLTVAFMAAGAANAAATMRIEQHTDLHPRPGTVYQHVDEALGKLSRLEDVRLDVDRRLGGANRIKHRGIKL